MNESRHTYKYVILYTWKGHVIYITAPPHSPLSKTSRILQRGSLVWMSYGTHTNRSCNIHERAKSNVPRHKHGWVMSHVTYVSCHICHVKYMASKTMMIHSLARSLSFFTARLSRRYIWKSHLIFWLIYIYDAMTHPYIKKVTSLIHIVNIDVKDIYGYLLRRYILCRYIWMSHVAFKYGCVIASYIWMSQKNIWLIYIVSIDIKDICGHLLRRYISRRHIWMSHVAFFLYINWVIASYIWMSQKVTWPIHKYRRKRYIGISITSTYFLTIHMDESCIFFFVWMSHRVIYMDETCHAESMQQR